ncbi:DNA topoisomerase IB [Legionella sp. WA2022007384]
MEDQLDSYSIFYGDDSIPGISREKNKDSFIYFDPNGTKITNKKTLQRIASLCIPPAYTRVWISPFENSHIQATGRDIKGKKQYCYHPLWKVIRDENKFKSLIPFGRMLPIVRKKVKRELNKPALMNKPQVICAIIYLLDNFFIRIGNTIYEKLNNSYGITTLRKKHLELSSTKAILDFKGKNSHPWHVILKDKKLIKILKKCESIPGYRLFKYLDENNNPIEISSQDVNLYLQNLTQCDFTAKDFRTWAACKEVLYRLSKINYDAEQLKNIILEVADLLGHTPTICKKCYILPEIINQWKKNNLELWVKKHPTLKENKDRLLLKWLEENINDIKF